MWPFERAQVKFSWERARGARYEDCQTRRMAPPFDAAYFRRFYGRRPVHTRRQIAHLGSGVLSFASWWRVPIRSVLDVGAGTGYWRDWLAEAHPSVTYHGIDASEYACRRFGHELADVAIWQPRRQYDLVVCQSVLQYLTTRTRRVGSAPSRSLPVDCWCSTPRPSPIARPPSIRRAPTSTSTGEPATGTGSAWASASPRSVPACGSRRRAAPCSTSSNEPAVAADPQPADDLGSPRTRRSVLGVPSSTGVDRLRSAEYGLQASLGF